MLSNLGSELFPNECEVLEIVPSHHYVFPIFKNGSSSLVESEFKKLNRLEIKNLKVVDVFVRDPTPRFFSGVKTYISKLDCSIDKKSVMYMIDRYLFLNRHFSPQLYWLINFRRFSKARFHIRPLSELKLITTKHKNKSDIDEEIRDYFINSSGKWRYYLEMDEVLTVNHIGQTVDLAQILTTLKTNYGSLYNDVFQTVKELNDVVS
jgi:hypothetical protein